MDYSRIISAVDIPLLSTTHIVMVGAGGAYSLACAFARMGLGRLTVLDIDIVDESNIIRQGYRKSDVGRFKVEALKIHIQEINPDLKYTGITENFLDMNNIELDRIFSSADLFLFLTDSFSAQSFGNILSLRYNTPAVWGGFYAKSRMGEVFFQIEECTPACFRCCMSARYLANKDTEIKVSSSCNTIFHSEFLDSILGFISMAIVHRNSLAELEFRKYFDALCDEKGIINHNFFQFKVHPLGTNALFEKYSAPSFVSHWQELDAETIINGYEYNCPDCKGEMIKPSG